MEEYLTIEELCEYLKISKQTVYLMTSRDAIPFFKVGRRLRFRREAIDKWAKEKEKMKVIKK